MIEINSDKALKNLYGSIKDSLLSIDEEFLQEQFIEDAENHASCGELYLISSYNKDSECHNPLSVSLKFQGDHVRKEILNIDLYEEMLGKYDDGEFYKDEIKATVAELRKLADDLESKLI